MSDIPASEMYKILFKRLKTSRQKKGDFDADVAVRSIAKTHANNVKDVIDEDMDEYNTKQLTNIVERCVAKYVSIEESD